MKATAAANLRKRIDQLRAARYSDERIAGHLEQEAPREDGRAWTAELVGQWMRDNAGVGYLAAVSPRSSYTTPRSTIET